MPRLRAAERALTLFASSNTPSQHYICLACRQHALRKRTLHTTSPLRAELSFLKRVQQSIFGSAEAKESERKRDEARKKRVEELSRQPEEERAEEGLEVIRDGYGREFEVAALVDETLDKEYVPATTWDELDRVGSEAWVRQRADGGEVYWGFTPAKALGLADHEWKKLLHHVAVEVLALRQAGRDVDQICNQRSSAEGASRTKHIGILTDGRNATLASRGDVMISDIEAGIPETAQEPGEGSFEILQEEAKLASGKLRPNFSSIAQEDDAWMQMPLSDPTIKLTITKRTTQLTGHRPRDIAIASARTLADLHSAFKTKEKPAKLRDTKQMRALGKDNPNVTVHNTRVTPIDKHKAVGRWKVIEDELNARGLPVVGHRGRDANTTVGLAGEKKKKRQKARKN